MPLFSGPSPTARSPSAAATSTAKSAEPSAAREAASSTAETASGPAAASARAATYHWANPPTTATPRTHSAALGSASARADQDEQQNQSKDNDAEWKFAAIVRRRFDLAARRLAGKRDAAIGDNVLGELPGGGFDGAAVVVLAKDRDHGAANIAGARVVYYRLEAVADFHAIFTIFRGDQQQNAAVGALWADAQLLVESHRVVFHAFALERVDRHDRKLRFGFLLQLGAQGFQAGFRFRRDDASQVGDIACRVNVFGLLGTRAECGERQHDGKNRGEPAAKNDGRAHASGTGVALLLPGVAIGMIAVALPETEAVVVEQREAADPLDAFPGVEMRNDQAQRCAMFGRERLTIVIEGEENIGLEKVGQRDVGGIALFREDQRELCFWLWLREFEDVGEKDA